ncbi:MAG TPA: glycosyltransferase, partial [Bryobacteraceae bacterium]|nr:glycosyltransferase [Bryobacteraceae bacterium]
MRGLHNIAVLIPAYEPGQALVQLIGDLAGRGFLAIVVVDDGSGPRFNEVFEGIKSIPGVVLLQHAINLGKGSALRTGMNHILVS